MNTCKINKTFFKNRKFKGVFACDQLPRRSEFNLPYALIINTDPTSKPGEHWVSIFANDNNHFEYFDSFGRVPSNSYIVDFVENNSSSSCYNTIRIQHELSKSCGQFAIGYLKARLCGYSANQFLSIFNLDNLIENDKIIEFFLNNCPAYAYASEIEDC